MILVKTALDFYYKEHIAVKAVARRRSEYSIEALKGFFSHTELKDVDIPMCREYRKSRVGIADSTVRLELGVLNAAANHNLRWRRIKNDDMPSVELPPAGRTKTIWLMKEELKSFAAAAKEVSERIDKFVVLAYYTAARKQSIETLKWDQIDLSANRINLAKANEQVTKKRRPIVPVPAEVLERLKHWKEQSTSEYFLDHPGSIRYEFDVAAKIAGLTKLKTAGMREAGVLTPHVLRHSRATHLLQDGKEPWAVANLLGDSLTTVLRVYGHACSSYMEGVLT